MIPTNVTDKTLYAIRDSLKTGLQSLCCKLDTLNMLNSEIIIDSVSPLVGDTAPTGAKLFYNTGLQRVTLAVVNGLWAAVLDIDPVTSPSVGLHVVSYTTQAADSNNILYLRPSAPINITLSDLTSDSVTRFVNGGGSSVTFLSGNLNRKQVANQYTLAVGGSCVGFSQYGYLYLSGDLS